MDRYIYDVYIQERLASTVLVASNQLASNLS
jgi:hypothetical protein